MHRLCMYIYIYMYTYRCIVRCIYIYMCMYIYICIHSPGFRDTDPRWGSALHDCHGCNLSRYQKNSLAKNNSQRGSKYSDTEVLGHGLENHIVCWTEPKLSIGSQILCLPWFFWTSYTIIFGCLENLVQVMGATQLRPRQAQPRRRKP